MGFFRFRRSIKVMPGIRLNLSKSGVSTSLGVRGAHVTIGHGKVRETVGLPGTGISYTEVHDSEPRAADRPSEDGPPGVLTTAWNLFFLMVVLGVVLVLGYACGTMIR